MRYDYLENVKADVLEYIKENYEKEDYANLDYDELYDEMFLEDSITGNASGSYYCNEYKAQECLIGNFDLIRESLEYFGNNVIDIELLNGEWLDVTIRCYLLGQALQEVLEDLRGEE